MTYFSFILGPSFAQRLANHASSRHHFHQIFSSLQCSHSSAIATFLGHWCSLSWVFFRHHLLCACLHSAQSFWSLPRSFSDFLRGLLKASLGLLQGIFVIIFMVSSRHFSMHFQGIFSNLYRMFIYTHVMVHCNIGFVLYSYILKI